ncbi:pep-cterm sorting domain-containing protein [Anaeramoeba flamelloides]|uniref:Pep-cterm sorting domain-containing protein n=1 Tax=Anaeramoeba flamelloides TaxID=1746091 RepID=A0ABQ8X6N8_9EUKA|nr:pep-cterm sorting domain-containing protein [Anaeramoeba flamelloides]
MNFETLYKVYHKLINDEELSDVTLQVGEDGTKFHCHRLILSLASPVLKKRLYPQNWKTEPEPSNSILIEIPGVEPNTFSSFLKFIYTRSLIINPKEIEGLLGLSIKFQIDKLLMLVLEEIKKEIMNENCIKFLLLGEKYNLKPLKDLATNYFYRNSNKILENESTLNNLKHETIKNILQSKSIVATEIQLFRSIYNWGKRQLKLRNANKGKNSDDDNIIEEEELNVDIEEEKEKEKVDNENKNENRNVNEKSQVTIQEILKDLIPLIRIDLMKFEDLVELKKSNVFDSDLLFENSIRLHKLYSQKEKITTHTSRVAKVNKRPRERSLSKDLNFDFNSSNFTKMNSENKTFNEMDQGNNNFNEAIEIAFGEQGNILNNHYNIHKREKGRERDKGIENVNGKKKEMGNGRVRKKEKEKEKEKEMKKESRRGRGKEKEKGKETESFRIQTELDTSYLKPYSLQTKIIIISSSEEEELNIYQPLFTQLGIQNYQFLNPCKSTSYPEPRPARDIILISESNKRVKYLNPESLGNYISQCIDVGNGLIAFSTFAFTTDSQIRGRFLADGYLAHTDGKGLKYKELRISMSRKDTHPILSNIELRNIVVKSSYLKVSHSKPMITVAQWDSDQPMIVDCSDPLKNGRIILFNCWPYSMLKSFSWVLKGQFEFDSILVNALKYVGYLDNK